MESFNIYITGVGGQGIGLLSEVLLRAADYAGYFVKAVDTHGLAQRGGIVVSQLRLGAEVYSPLIPKQSADLVVALERHEAMRALNIALKDGGRLVYYDTVWQPLDVRLGQATEASAADLQAQCRRRKVQLHRVYCEDLAEARMQNIVVLAYLDKHGLIPGFESDHFRRAMQDLMAGKMLEVNMALFDAEISTS